MQPCNHETMKPYLSVIIPAKGNLEHLPLTLVDIDRRLSETNYPAEIVVALDGTTEEAAEIVKKMAKTIKNLKLVENKDNKNIGSLVRQGILLSGGEIRLIADHYNSISINEFNHMIPHFKDGAHVVVGSRRVGANFFNPHWPIKKRIVSRILNFVVKPITPSKIKDPTCRFKAFSAEAAEKIFNNLRFKGAAFNLEILIRAKKKGLNTREIPVIVSNQKLTPAQLV